MAVILALPKLLTALRSKLALVFVLRLVIWENEQNQFPKIIVINLSFVFSQVSSINVSIFLVPFSITIILQLDVQIYVSGNHNIQATCFIFGKNYGTNPAITTSSQHICFLVLVTHVFGGNREY